MDKKAKLRGFFVCNKCRATCECSEECMGDLVALHPRKQSIGCLGEYCDEPCELRTESDLTVEKLVPLVIFLGSWLNELLIVEE